MPETVLAVRPLQEGDFDKGASRLVFWHTQESFSSLPLLVDLVSTAGAGVMQLLSQLTVVGDVTRETFAARCADLSAGPEHVMVVEGASPTFASVALATTSC